ncbi:MAG TPA: hypothetical protein VIU64_08930 [Polyangia bacterium]
MKRALGGTRSAASAVLYGTFVIAAAVGCDSRPSGVRTWCEGVCAAIARCGRADSGCASRCVDGEPGLVHLSSGGGSALKPCLEQLSCLAVGGDDSAWKSEQMACWTSAEMSVGVADHARRLCSTFALAWFECGYSLAIDECARIYSMWDDTVLDRLAACEAKQTCEELQSCQQAAYQDR